LIVVEIEWWKIISLWGEQVVVLAVGGRRWAGGGGGNGHGSLRLTLSVHVGRLPKIFSTWKINQVESSRVASPAK